MTRYQVWATADLCFEVDAADSENAAFLIANSFKLNAPYDPLANVRIRLNSGIDAELKMTTIQEWSVPEIETREAD